MHTDFLPLKTLKSLKNTTPCFSVFSALSGLNLGLFVYLCLSVRICGHLW
jgi:hypothetical protein